MHHVHTALLAYQHSSPERQSFSGAGTRRSHVVQQTCKAKCQQICLWRPMHAAASHTAAITAAKSVLLIQVHLSMVQGEDPSSTQVQHSSPLLATYRHVHDGCRRHDAILRRRERLAEKRMFEEMNGLHLSPKNDRCRVAILRLLGLLILRKPIINSQACIFVHFLSTPCAGNLYTLSTSSQETTREDLQHLATVNSYTTLTTATSWLKVYMKSAGSSSCSTFCVQAWSLQPCTTHWSDPGLYMQVIQPCTCGVDTF